VFDRKASSDSPEKHMPASYTESPLPIGKLVQSYIGKIFRACDDDELMKLMDKQYTKDTFDINFPFCAELENITHVRYWKHIHVVRGKTVRVCSQWFEGSRKYFCQYIESKNIVDKKEAPPRAPLSVAEDNELDSQVIEILGHNRLTDELFRSGLEVAHPARDRGVDLIAYVDLEVHVQSFVARPIQMKAASRQSFSIDRKYAKFPNLLIAFVWNLANGSEPITFAMSYAEALMVGDSWDTLKLTHGSAEATRQQTRALVYASYLNLIG
jgi:hypothetical protein